MLERNQAEIFSNIYFEGLNLMLGLLALRTGALHRKNAVEICPWSPKLPLFLLIFGIVSLFSPLLFSLKTIRGSNDWRSVLFISTMSIFGRCGIILWGFHLLYSNPEPVKYDKDSFGSSVLSENHCKETVYLVSMSISWVFAAILVLSGFCLLFVRTYMHLGIFLFKRTVQTTYDILFGSFGKKKLMKIKTLTS